MESEWTKGIKKSFCLKSLNANTEYAKIYVYILR